MPSGRNWPERNPMQSVRNRPKVCLSVYRLVSDSGLSTPQETTIAAEAGVQNSRLRLSAGPYFTLSDPRTKDMRSAKRVFARRQVAKRLPPPPFSDLDRPRFAGLAQGRRSACRAAGRSTQRNADIAKSALPRCLPIFPEVFADRALTLLKYPWR